MFARVLFFSLFLTIFASQGLPKDKITEEHIDFEGRKRTYYLFIPGKLDLSKPAPLLVALHGLGATGYDPVELLMPLATANKFILVGPNAIHSWQGPDDWPDFLYALVESLKPRLNVDSRRVYLFGNSAGGCFAAVTALLEPGYFAAVAVRAGILPIRDLPLNNRRIPIGFWIGELDPYFSVGAVHDTGQFMFKQGFKVRITLIPGLGHSYGRSIPGTEKINQEVWSFLESKVLEGDPEWVVVSHMKRKLWPWPAGY
jgi:polyhydroxybutyrate depolymerase